MRVGGGRFRRGGLLLITAIRWRLDGIRRRRQEIQGIRKIVQSRRLEGRFVMLDMRQYENLHAIAAVLRIGLGCSRRKNEKNYRKYSIMH